MDPCLADPEASGPDRLLRLNPTVEYEFPEGGSVVVRVRRGESVTRYTMNRTIHDFLERFRIPARLGDVARAMAEEGFDAQRVHDFARQLVKTPLIELFNPDADADTVTPFLREQGFSLEIAYKQKQFEGVFKVRDAGGHAFVVKAMHTPEPTVVETVRARLRNEYEVLRALSPVEGVVRALGFRDGNRPGLTMEFVPGEPLLEHEQSDLRTRLSLASRVARIIAGVHAEGVIHGDLHTSNFLRGADDRVTLIDFDCAFFIDSAYRPRNGGALHFLPPERVVDRWHETSVRPADRSSDIYQAGVVIYAVLTNNLPFRGATMTALASSIRAGAFRPPEYTPEGDRVPADVVEFVCRTLAAHQEDRPIRMDDYPYVSG
jgi:serine/threonine protein kinase